MKTFLSLVIGTLSLFIVGCETTHSFSVNSLNHPAPIGDYKTFAIAAGPDIENPDALEFLEAARYAETALISEGYREADNPDEADLIVELSFAISEPQTTFRERSEPIYGYTGGGYRQRVVKVRGKDGKTYSKVVNSYYPPRHRVIGWDNDIYAQTNFEKSLIMRAYSEDIESQDALRKEIWMVEVRNRNESQDLRYYVPRMVAAALDYIDYDSGSLQTVRLAESDPRIQLILGPAIL